MNLSNSDHNKTSKQKIVRITNRCHCLSIMSEYACVQYLKFLARQNWCRKQAAISSLFSIRPILIYDDIINNCFISHWCMPKAILDWRYLITDHFCPIFEIQNARILGCILQSVHSNYNTNAHIFSSFSARNVSIIIIHEMSFVPYIVII